MDELDHLQTQLWDSTLNFRKAAMSPGIISSINPMDDLATSFKVSVSGSQLLVNVGSVMFEDGHIAKLENPQYLDIPAVSSMLVATYIEQASGYQRTLFAEEVEPLISRMLKVELVSESQYAVYSLNQTHEVLAYVSSAGIAYSLSGKSLRRWANIYDWNHRAKVGSGKVTDANIHGLTLFDMAFNSGLGVWSALGNDGILVTTKETEGNVAYSGSLMKVTIFKEEWTKVSDTLYTYVPPFQPLTCLYLKDSTGTQVAFKYGLSSNVPTVKLTSVPPAQAELLMSVCATLNFRVDKENPFSLSALSSQSTEQIIYKGAPLQASAQPVINLATWADYPMKNLKLYLTSDNQLTTLPQEAKSAAKLSGLSGAGQTVNIIFSSASKVRMVLANNTAKVTLNIVVKVTGKDANGKIITDTITFDKNWAANADKNSAYSTLEFLSISFLQLTTGTDADISTTYRLFANIPVNGFLVSSFNISTLGIESYQDLRNVQIAPLGLASDNREHTFSDPYLADPYLSTGIAGGYLNSGGVFVSRLLTFPVNTRIRLLADYHQATDDALIITWTNAATPTKITSGTTFVDIKDVAAGYLTIKSPSKLKGFIIEPLA
ncbi:hypothetical protein EAH77_15975 [Ewingella americana]|uniref:Uncharacterized protein n=2 Tax=Ewingella americana TaxID=41202 RepID=A0A502GDX1_9GAMM|nr:hypothetical protein EAH77_15975 [Ewingella americana]